MIISIVKSLFIFAMMLLIYQGISYAAAPVFDEGSTTTRSVDKGTYPLQDLGDPVSATDADDDTLTYTLSGTDAALFEIDSTNGQLSNKDFLHYEDKTSYSVTVNVSDNNGGTDTISVTITDDKSPVAVIRTFIRQNENWILEQDSETGVVSAIIPENDRPINSDVNVASFIRPPGVVFENSFIVAISFDEEVSGLDQSELTLTNNTSGANVTSWETLMGWTGNNTVTQYSAKVEVTQSGTVTFNVAANAATDGSGNSNAAAESKTVNVTITLTEYAPWDVNEDGSVDATDLALVTDAFGQTGETIVNSRTDVNWDDTVDADDVTLVTYHMDSVDDPTPNNPPAFVNEAGEYIIATNVFVSENQSNYLIGSVKAVDEDEDDTLTYSLDADSNVYTLMPGQKQSYNDLYTINSETGEVHIGSSGLDYDTYPVFSKVPPLKYQPVWVKVEDGNGGSARFAYQVLIKDENDNPPVFSEDSQILSINENEPSDTTVGTVSASDADKFAGDHTYSIETEGVPFFIESSKRSGTIKTTAMLDYEATKSYTLTVKVDDGFGTDTIEVTINVVDIPEVTKPETMDTSEEDQEVVTPILTDILDDTMDTSEEDQEVVTPTLTDTLTEPGTLLLKPGQIGFSELMYASRGGLHSLSQWIELFNNSETQVANLNGWELQIEARDVTGTHRHYEITLEELHIPAKQTVLIVTWGSRNSDDFSADRVYNLINHHYDDFEQNEHRNMVIGLEGFFLKLSDPNGVVSDIVGNLDGDPSTRDEPVWKLPTGTTEVGARTSLLRRYEKETNRPLDGTDLNNWKRASELGLSVIRYWGKTTDIGNPGYRGSGALPVTLSHFSAERAESTVVLKWTTESEVDNAGFYIYRSITKDGKFKVVNSQMIQGAGTTGERNEYTWTDTTAKPNTVYYYRIEDVSHAGERKQLATVRLRGFVSPKNKFTISWADLKVQQ